MGKNFVGQSKLRKWICYQYWLTVYQCKMLMVWVFIVKFGFFAFWIMNIYLSCHPQLQLQQWINNVKWKTNNNDLYAMHFSIAFHCTFNCFQFDWIQLYDSILFLFLFSWLVPLIRRSFTSCDRDWNFHCDQIGVQTIVHRYNVMENSQTEPKVSGDCKYSLLFFISSIMFFFFELKYKWYARSNKCQRQ